MKIGLIIAEYNSIDYIEKCLTPWIEYREKSHSHNLVICITDVKFQETEDNNPSNNSNDGSVELLERYLSEHKIDCFIKSRPNLKEHEARNPMVKFCLDEQVDYIITWGIDEIIEKEQINQIFNYISMDEFIAWYSIQYKNFVFDEKHYVLGFNPPRVFKTKMGKYRLLNFYWDDDIVYSDGVNNYNYKDLSSKTVANVLVNHYTWNDAERSKKKIEYQMKHFGGICSYRFNPETGLIEFNPDYYKDKPTPQVYEE